MVSIVIPSRNRPELLRRAAASALGQSFEDLEVVVVDDASETPVALPEDRRLRIVRLPRQSGGAAARNAGLRAARGRWIAFLDDDDTLLPEMVEVSLDALAGADLPRPVAAISGIEVVDAEGRVLATRIPPERRAKGEHFFLEPIEPNRSYLTKQTLIVERDVLQGIGGWDPAFRSRVHSELFLRLNPECSILGLPRVTYRLSAHRGPRVSRDRTLRQESYQRMVAKHRLAFAAHPEPFAEFAYAHARRSIEEGQRWSAATTLLQAARLAPRPILARLARDSKRSARRVLRPLGRAISGRRDGRQRLDQVIGEPSGQRDNGERR